MSSNPLQLEASDGRLHLAASELVDFQYLRTLAYELYGAASVGEVLRAAHDIARKGGTRDVYIDTWAEQGRHNARRAQEALALGQHQTARTHFLRAYNYLRAAEFFFDRRDRANFDAIYFESVAAFDQAIALFEMPVEKIDIPFENGVSMPGYFFKAGKDDQPRATVILSGGGDGHGEETYFLGGVPEALARGLNVLLFHGPGQRGLLHRHPDQVMRVDAEIPFGAVVEYALSRRDVDHRRLALYGMSFGGYLAPRAAAHDARIKALIANAPIRNFYDLLSKQAQEAEARGEQAPVSDWAWEAMIDNYMLWNNGASSFPDFVAKAWAYTLEGLEQKITCPTLVLSAEGEGAEARAQAQQFYEALQCPKSFHALSIADGADGHCGLNNIALTSALVYDWVTGIFGR
ncbi:alpha/beta hydrolase family protein [Thermogemmatispora carboxidivorans]|uniref:alpha/beta hydrolase family protein n=1 Tax=Thermogemmatispora carboxidivorans TaxID=1382306 RepID=UPI00069AE128|nr:prolyl oligopeptidase family serine peptidase [Thermogemmatispora carboxidivorans]